MCDITLPFYLDKKKKRNIKMFKFISNTNPTHSVLDFSDTAELHYKVHYKYC